MNVNYGRETRTRCRQKKARYETGLEGIQKLTFREDPRRQPKQVTEVTWRQYKGKPFIGSSALLYFCDQRLRPAAATLVALAVAALKLASAMSVACLTAFCTDSNALLAADTALLNTATEVSEPAGAFLAAVSTSVLKLRCASTAWVSTALVNSVPVPEAMSYR